MPPIVKKISSASYKNSRTKYSTRKKTATKITPKPINTTPTTPTHPRISLINSRPVSAALNFYLLIEPSSKSDKYTYSTSI